MTIDIHGTKLQSNLKGQFQIYFGPCHSNSCLSHNIFPIVKFYIHKTMIWAHYKHQIFNSNWRHQVGDNNDKGSPYLTLTDVFEISQNWTNSKYTINHSSKVFQIHHKCIVYLFCSNPNIPKLKAPLFTLLYTSNLLNQITPR